MLLALSVDKMCTIATNIRKKEEREEEETSERRRGRRTRRRRGKRTVEGFRV
jgi:hypothetical protein